MCKAFTEEEEDKDDEEDDNNSTIVQLWIMFQVYNVAGGKEALLEAVPQGRCSG